MSTKNKTIPILLSMFLLVSMLNADENRDKIKIIEDNSVTTIALDAEYKRLLKKKEKLDKEKAEKKRREERE